MREKIWHDFVFNRYTIKHLGAKHSRSIDWVRKELRAYEPPPLIINSRKIIAVMDCVFFGRSSGYMVVRDPHQKQNVYWAEIERETLWEYQCARDTLESLGFEVQAVVVDGKPGLKRFFGDIPIQMCHFHQKAITRRYLTMRPRLQAGRELKEVVRVLGKTTEAEFVEMLSQWHLKWAEFLKERTTNPLTGKSHFTHRRLRSAHLSIKRNLPYLFTYKKHPELDIPNTTNGLEGSFSYLKELVRVHRGLNQDLKRKMIDSILQNRPTN